MLDNLQRSGVLKIILDSLFPVESKPVRTEVKKENLHLADEEKKIIQCSFSLDNPPPAQGLLPCATVYSWRRTYSLPGVYSGNCFRVCRDMEYTRKPLIQEIGMKMRAPHRGIGETNTQEYRRSQGHRSHVLSNTEGLRNNCQDEHILPYSGFLGA